MLTNNLVILFKTLRGVKRRRTRCWSLDGEWSQFSGSTDTMTRKSQLHPVSRHDVVWLQWKLVIFLYVALSLLSLVSIHLQYYSLTTLPPPALRRWDSYPPPHILRRQRPSEGRLPFLISAWSSAWLSVGQILQGFVLRLCLWSAPVTGCFLSLQESRLYASGNFLQGADQANFSVYVHSQPGFVFNEETTRSQYFYNRQLNNSINVSVVHVIIDDLNLSTLVRKKWIFFSWNNSIKLGVVYVFGDLNISTPIKTNRVCFEDYEHMSKVS